MNQPDISKLIAFINDVRKGMALSQLSLDESLKDLIPRTFKDEDINFELTKFLESKCTFPYISLAGFLIDLPESRHIESHLMKYFLYNEFYRSVILAPANKIYFDLNTNSDQNQIICVVAHNVLNT